ncbi:MAG: diguanylate cyclase, partial [Defluviicoccus sp.]|nr:diguanylate cyclase [Defluviicoccus sp.]
LAILIDCPVDSVCEGWAGMGRDEPSAASETEPPAPPFTLRDAEQIVRRLAPALHEHGAWVRRVHTMLICRTQPAAEDLSPEGERATELALWFRDEESEYIRRHPHYAEAEASYREVRSLAADLLRAIADDVRIAPAEYGAFASAVARFEENMEALISGVWMLLSATDPLTGIATLPALMPRLQQERDRLRRTNNVCSVCMIDLDHFKEINDRYGHAVGNKVLEAVSRYFASRLRRYDQVCRYGGEEFVIMLPDTDLEAAVPIIERLRSGLARLPVILDDGTRLTITGSFGIAPLAPTEPVHASIAHADQAMYEAKRSGRNQVRLWQEPRATG